ncbi:hypothetical protein K432DRAFT_129623 [Lepidopterella palustris CBS 459.81]|uniref:Uncharacterized protein n=1 Tax=Lepidopterella palustris CBS 459.81 TaxID=1314670 RepID=A0A8E2E4K0_9PEZI|nr:hypothetical protein K432DRAFT_129623 [Lepidopterella palustris CBS 459.81]
MLSAMEAIRRFLGILFLHDRRVERGSQHNRCDWFTGYGVRVREANACICIVLALMRPYHVVKSLAYFMELQVRSMRIIDVVRRHARRAWDLPCRFLCSAKLAMNGFHVGCVHRRGHNSHLNDNHFLSQVRRGKVGRLSLKRRYAVISIQGASINHKQQQVEVALMNSKRI